jgi:aminoglycoside phosphotransferase (APT) family kinase protein
VPEASSPAGAQAAPGAGGNDAPAVPISEAADAPGIEVAAVDAWLGAHVPGAAPPFRYDLVAAGGSNLTFRITDSAGSTWALRRPPTAHVLASAHDMGREWRIIAGLDGSPVPVPAAVAYCDDVAVTGAPFYVMGFVDGFILRDRAGAALLTAEEIEVATDSLVDVQVALHALDPETVGLGELGRPTGYVPRQLARWRKQYEAGKVREVPLLEDLHERLSATVPKEQRPGVLAHGDYRFDNTVLGADRRVIAVLDWELCTRGDPVADFCWSLMYWADPGDEFTFLSDAPTLDPRFVRSDEYAARYAERSGLDLSDRAWYVAFSCWKQACIVEGAYARRLAGARMGMPDRGDPSSIAVRVDTLLAMGDQAFRALSGA